MVKWRTSHLLFTNSLVNEIQSLLDFLADGRWSRNMITRSMESSLISGIMNCYQLTLRTGVRITSLLDEWLDLIFTLTHRLQISTLFRDNVVTGLVAEINAKINSTRLQNESYSSRLSWARRLHLCNCNIVGDGPFTLLFILGECLHLFTIPGGKPSN